MCARNPPNYKRDRVCFVFWLTILFGILVGKLYQMTEQRQLQPYSDSSLQLEADTSIETTGPVKQSSLSPLCSPLGKPISSTEVLTPARELFFKKYLTPAGMDIMSSYLRGQCTLYDSAPISGDV